MAGQRVCGRRPPASPFPSPISRLEPTLSPPPLYDLFRRGHLPEERVLELYRLYYDKAPTRLADADFRIFLRQYAWPVEGDGLHVDYLALGAAIHERDMRIAKQQQAAGLKFGPSHPPAPDHGLSSSGIGKLALPIEAPPGNTPYQREHSSRWPVHQSPSPTGPRGDLHQGGELSSGAGSPSKAQWHASRGDANGDRAQASPTRMELPSGRVVPFGVGDSPAVHFLSGRIAPMPPQPSTGGGGTGLNATLPTDALGSWANAPRALRQEGTAAPSVAADSAVRSIAPGSFALNVRGNGTFAADSFQGVDNTCGPSKEKPATLSSKPSPIGHLSAGFSYGGSSHHNTAAVAVARRWDLAIRAIRTALEAADTSGQGLAAPAALMLLCRMHGIPHDTAQIRALLQDSQHREGKVVFIDFLRRLTYLLDHDLLREWRALHLR